MKHSGAEELSEDNILDILHRVPSNSLCSFKCVSKHWRHLISGSESMKSESCRSKRWISSPPMIGFFYQDVHTVSRPRDGGFIFTSRKGRNLVDGISLEESIGFLDHKNVYIIASSKGFLLCCRRNEHSQGLLCCRQNESSLRYYPVKEYAMEYYVYNPATKQWLALPEPQSCYEQVGVGFSCKVDDPGSDLISYTVVRCAIPGIGKAFEEQSSVKIESFSSLTSSWAVYAIKFDVPHCLYPVEYPAVVIDEVFFWLDRGPQIFAIDVVKRCSWLLDLPHAEANYYELYASNGTLFYVADHGVLLSIWSLESNIRCPKATWLTRYQGHFLHSISKSPEIVGPADSAEVECLGMHPNCSDIFYYCFNGRVISWDIHKDTVELVESCSLSSSFTAERYRYFPYEWNEWPRLLPPLKPV